MRDLLNYDPPDSRLLFGARQSLFTTLKTNTKIQALSHNTYIETNFSNLRLSTVNFEPEVKVKKPPGGRVGKKIAVAIIAMLL